MLGAAGRAVGGGAAAAGWGERRGAEAPDAPLTVVTSVVDAHAPQVADTMRATMTVLAVSAGAATAEQLARVAVSAAGTAARSPGSWWPTPTQPTTQPAASRSQPTQTGEASPARATTESIW